jgi:hypothetical protein
MREHQEAIMSRASKKKRVKRVAARRLTFPTDEIPTKPRQEARLISHLRALRRLPRAQHEFQLAFIGLLIEEGPAFVLDECRRIVTVLEGGAK